MTKTKFMFICAAMSISVASNANAYEIQARNAILMDATTGEYLFVKDHEKMIPPASMSKLMTIYLLFEELKKGNVSLEDTFTVSENAWRKGGAATGGSTMFLKIGEEVKVEDLIRGIIVQSGNDACIVVAENIAGTEEEFAALMNEKAAEIGLKNSHFANSTGLPDSEHKMSVEDLAKLSERIINEFPEFYHIFSQKEFTYNGIKQGNRNPLLYSMIGADGLKTGHTEEAGFSLTASAKRGDRRLIAVMAGMKSNKERADESNSLMAYGFSEFDNYTIITADDVVAEIPVWYGKEKTVDAGVDKDLIKTMQRIKSKTAKVKLFYDKPLTAPVAKGQKVGEIVVEYDENENIYPLIAKKDVKKLGILGRFIANVKYLLFGDE